MVPELHDYNWGSEYGMPIVSSVNLSVSVVLKLQSPKEENLS